MNKKNKYFGQNTYLKAADLIRRLPVHQQLNNSQAALIKLTPVWQQWATRAINKNIITKECYQNTELGSLRNGKLVINCSNAVYASQIKHQQQSILDSIIKDGITDVEQINIQLSIQSGTTIQQRYANNSDGNQHDSESAFAYSPLTPNSLTALDNCQKSVNNDQLASSLKRLAETLKKLSQ